jgi:DNA-directed RNA polymerase subunit M/transcription elongation factor TFIIS
MSLLTTPLKLIGVSLIFEILDDKQDRYFSSDLVKINNKEPLLKDPQVQSFICDKCGKGEMIFHPVENDDGKVALIHQCSDCHHEEELDMIYPALTVNIKPEAKELTFDCSLTLSLKS